jgi:serine phosphatase RsbU (regulator of sigma subunit)
MMPGPRTKTVRFWILFSLLLVLIGCEGALALLVFARFTHSVAELQAMQTAGMKIDEFGLLLNNFVKEMKVSTGIAQAGADAVPLPPTTSLAEGARGLGLVNAEVQSAALTRLLGGVAELRTAVGEYGLSLQRGQREEATIAFIETIEPLADRLLSKDFPDSRQAILAEVARVSEANRRAGAFARRALGVSLIATLAVGLLLGKLMLAALRQAAAQERELERRASELAIARSIQTSVLPHDLLLPGYDIGAVMLTAEEVGGDFYEFRPRRDGGAWVAVGDVTGHGLRSGLVMLMAQSMFTMLSEEEETAEASPQRLLARLNRSLFFNLRDRLHEDKYMTMVVARIFPDGRLVYAGAHTDLLVYRCGEDRVDRIATDGVWLGLLPELPEEGEDREIRLAPGDVALFHTDGVTEARDASGRQFDLERLADRLREWSGESAARVVERIVAAAREWAPVPADDISLMAIKRS